MTKNEPKYTEEELADFRWMETFDFLCQEEKEWLKERSERQKSLEEWKKELGDFPAKARARYLRQEIHRLSEELNRRADEYRAVLESPKHDWLLPLLERNAEGVANMIKRYRRELAVLKGAKGSDITDEMIERAKNYPIEDIVEVRRGRARCVCFIKEKTSIWMCGRILPTVTSAKRVGM